jgi:ectoine hydroxylase-related dioxygenase (phytanoyl-CoA dioxygenase family)
MWALDDFTPENGATLVVPGSHRWPPDRRAVDGEAVAAVMPAGSVLFYAGSVLHAGGANRTAAPRLGVILEYCAGWLRPQENHVLGVPKAIVRELPDRLRELLGYGIHGSLLGYVDGRHPAKFLADARAVDRGVVAAAVGAEELDG